MLSSNDRRSLLRLAREAIAARLEERPMTKVPPATGELSRRTGAFVTLTLESRLRGCIGSIERDAPLVEVVARCAADAATRDPRFSPVTTAELPAIALEISVIGPFEPLTDSTSIDVGRHGLVVEQGRRRGLLLPQVAAERNWTREIFLAQTCLKAGLADDAWRQGAAVFTFEAYVFDEASL